MQKVKTQRFGALFVKNMLITYFYMVKTYKVKIHSLTSSEIFSGTHNPNRGYVASTGSLVPSSS